MPNHAGRHRDRQVGPGWLRLRDTSLDRLRHWGITQAWLREWWISVVSVGLILATVLTVVVFLAVRDTDGPPAAAENPIFAPLSITPSPSPTIPSTPSPTPAPSRAVASRPVDLLAGYATKVQQQIDAGELERDAGRRLLRQLAEAARRLQEGDRDEAAEKLADVADRLHELRDEGELSRAGYRALDVLDPIIEAIA